MILWDEAPNINATTQGLDKFYPKTSFQLPKSKAIHKATYLQNAFPSQQMEFHLSIVATFTLTMQQLIPSSCITFIVSIVTIIIELVILQVKASFIRVESLESFFLQLVRKICHSICIIATIKSIWNKVWCIILTESCIHFYWHEEVVHG